MYPIFGQVKEKILPYILLANADCEKFAFSMLQYNEFL